MLGTLPINLVAEVNARGERYFHLTCAATGHVWHYTAQKQAL
ncbi:MAG: hypothetical protein KDI44_16090 [Thiothrix sp.]|nr:hypothetical protein [Thiothrix sp.]